MPGKKLNKVELAKAKVLSDLGYTPTSIGRLIGRDHKTVASHLRRVDFSDPVTQLLIKKLKESELAELHGIGGKARAILNDYLDDVLDGKREPQLIPITAVLDRTFTQKRLLEGASTQIIDYSAIHKTRESLEARLAELKAQRIELTKDANGSYAAPAHDLESGEKALLERNQGAKIPF